MPCCLDQHGVGDPHFEQVAVAAFTAVLAVCERRIGDGDLAAVAHQKPAGLQVVSVCVGRLEAADVLHEAVFDPVEGHGVYLVVRPGLFKVDGVGDADTHQPYVAQIALDALDAGVVAGGEWVGQGHVEHDGLEAVVCGHDVDHRAPKERAPLSAGELQF